MFSDPVVGDKFFGRKESLDLLTKRVSGLKDGFRQNIAILGPKLIGKTSLILHFSSTFNHPQIIPIYIDLRPNSFHHFVFKFLSALLYRYLENKNLKVFEELDSLKRHAQDYIPKTVETIRAIENNMHNLQFGKVYETLLSLTAVFKSESGISSIVILDDFHLLNTYKVQTPFAHLAKEIMMQKDTMYALISSQINYAKKVLANELSLLFGNFEIVHLEHFDYTTSCKFLEKRFQNITLPQHLQDFLIDFSKGHPFYLDIVSNKILEKAKQLNSAEVTPDLIGQAFNSLIYDSKGILNQYFTSLLSHNLNGADYANFIPILLSASERGCKLSDISKLTKRKPQFIAKQINYLLDKDLLNKVGIFYRIQDRLFRFWLKSAYQRKRLSLASDPTVESKEFSKEIEERVLRFSHEIETQLTERMIDLFQAFNNEVIMIQNRLFKLWRFEEVRPWPKQNSHESIIVRYKQGYWICWIKKDEIDEGQLVQFIQLCKKSKYKIRRIIIIALKELDLNVRLMALENKLWIWTLADLNLILDLYGKQQIGG